MIEGVINAESIDVWQQENPGAQLILSGADLSGADLYGADLRGADLRRADLHDAYLRYADLRRADLHDANLSGANLIGADLHDADLRRANLRAADLRGAILRAADITEAKLSHFQIPDGNLIVWGKKADKLVLLRIPANARRTACLINRKCRAEFADVIQVFNKSGEVIVSNRYGETIYKAGERVFPHMYDDDIRIDCAGGIHFWLTKQEAIEW